MLNPLSLSSIALLPLYTLLHIPDKFIGKHKRHEDGIFQETGRLDKNDLNDYGRGERWKINEKWKRRTIKGLTTQIDSNTTTTLEGWRQERPAENTAHFHPKTFLPHDRREDTRSRSSQVIKWSCAPRGTWPTIDSDKQVFFSTFCIPLRVEGVSTSACLSCSAYFSFSFCYNFVLKKCVFLFFFLQLTSSYFALIRTVVLVFLVIFLPRWLKMFPDLSYQPSTFPLTYAPPSFPPLLLSVLQHGLLLVFHLFLLRSSFSSTSFPLLPVLHKGTHNADVRKQPQPIFSPTCLFYKELTLTIKVVSCNIKTIYWKSQYYNTGCL